MVKNNSKKLLFAVVIVLIIAFAVYAFYSGPQLAPRSKSSAGTPLVTDSTADVLCGKDRNFLFTAQGGKIECFDMGLFVAPPSQAQLTQFGELCRSENFLSPSQRQSLLSAAEQDAVEACSRASPASDFRCATTTCDTPSGPVPYQCQKTPPVVLQCAPSSSSLIAFRLEYTSGGLTYGPGSCDNKIKDHMYCNIIARAEATGIAKSGCDTCDSH